MYVPEKRIIIQMKMFCEGNLPAQWRAKKNNVQ